MWIVGHGFGCSEQQQHGLSTYLLKGVFNKFFANTLTLVCFANSQIAQITAIAEIRQLAGYAHQPAFMPGSNNQVCMSVHVPDPFGVIHRTANA